MVNCLIDFQCDVLHAHDNKCPLEYGPDWTGNREETNKQNKKIKNILFLFCSNTTGRINNVLSHINNCKNYLSRIAQAVG